MGAKSGWAVQLLGEKIDLDDLEERLPPPFDPYVEIDATSTEKHYYLRSKDWDCVINPSEVYFDADRMLERLHGQARLYDPDATRIDPGGVHKIDDAGRRHISMIMKPATLNIKLGRVRARGRGVALGGSPKPPAPTETQSFFQKAEKDELRAELLAQLSRATDWYDLYKVMEITRRLAGNQTALKKLLDENYEEWERVWRTANCRRHAPDPIKYPLPNPPAELDEGYRLVLRAVREVI